MEEHGASQEGRGEHHCVQQGVWRLEDDDDGHECGEREADVRGGCHHRGEVCAVRGGREAGAVHHLASRPSASEGGREGEEPECEGCCLR